MRKRDEFPLFFKDVAYLAIFFGVRFPPLLYTKSVPPPRILSSFLNTVFISYKKFEKQKDRKLRSFLILYSSLYEKLY